MRFRRVAAASVLIGFTMSCYHNSTPPSASPAPSAGSAPAARPAPPPPPPPAAPPQAAPPPTAGGPPPGGAGGPPGGGRGQPQTAEQVAARREQMNTMRAGVIADLMARIAGNENKPAGEQFKNVQLMKDSTSANFLKTMDYYGKSLSQGCQFCHAAGGAWDDDSKGAKKTARVMIQLVNLINTQGLSKLPARGNGQTPTISCMTCHRGRGSPGTAMLPM